jgi:hypothetical protein
VLERCSPWTIDSSGSDDEFVADDADGRDACDTFFRGINRGGRGIRTGSAADLQQRLRAMPRRSLAGRALLTDDVRRGDGCGNAR